MSVCEKVGIKNFEWPFDINLNTFGTTDLSDYVFNKDTNGFDELIFPGL